IPPLDGSKILESLLPDSFGSAMESIEQYGFILLFIALFTGAFRPVFNVVTLLAWKILFLGVG
ncbi:MAG TPA: hypothetical protein VGO96_04585, partial [Pyrinomonadaceae bacterium]|nr:hypothetical protein [Pyrinomonadaceae bacterium]